MITTVIFSSDNILKYFICSTLPSPSKIYYYNIAILHSGVQDIPYICLLDEGEYKWAKMIGDEFAAIVAATNTLDTFVLGTSTLG